MWHRPRPALPCLRWCFYHRLPLVTWRSPAHSQLHRVPRATAASTSHPAIVRNGKSLRKAGQSLSATVSDDCRRVTSALSFLAGRHACALDCSPVSPTVVLAAYRYTPSSHRQQSVGSPAMLSKKYDLYSTCRLSESSKIECFCLSLFSCASMSPLNSFSWLFFHLLFSIIFCG